MTTDKQMSKTRRILELGALKRGTVTRRWHRNPISSTTAILAKTSLALSHLLLLHLCKHLGIGDRRDVMWTLEMAKANTR